MATWKKIITSGSAAELSSLTLDTALPVAQGGIGATSLTDKAVLISQDSSTNAVGAVALTTNGQIIIGGSGGPAAATITGTTNEVEITNGANSIQIGLPNDVTIGGGLTVTNDIDLTNSATDIDLVDDNASALSFDAAGKAGILEIDTTDSAEQVKMSGNLNVTGTISGSTISGSFVGDGSNLTGVSQDIDSLVELDDTPHQTDDQFLISDAGTEKRISMANVAKGVFAAADDGDDATIAADGGITINTGAVSSASIAADAIDENHLAANAVKTAAITDANVTLAKIANAAANTVIVRDANSSGVLSAKAVTNQQILIGDGTGFTAAALSGDVTMTNGGVVTIAADSVEGTMLSSSVADTTTMELSSDTLSVLKVPSALTAGTGITAGGTFDGATARTFAVDIDGLDAETMATGDTIAFNDDDDNGVHKITVDNLMKTTPKLVTEASIAQASDYILFLDGGATGETKKESVADFVDAINGTGLGASSGVLSVDLSGVTSQTIGDGSGTTTIGNNLVVNNDLTVNGDLTTIATTNTVVEDQLLFLGTGSAGTNKDVGIIAQSGSTDLQGSAFYNDITSERWSVAKSVNNNATAITPLQFVTTVKTDTVNPDSTSGSYGAGEMHVNTTSGDIWIRFG